MRVRKSSWHYRLWRFGRESHTSQPRDLCRYFWHLALIKVLLPTALAAMVLTGIITVLVVIWNNPLEAAITVALTVVTVGLVVGIVLLARRRHQASEREEPLGPPPKKEPSVLSQFISSRKQKICPLIEVIDDRDSY